MKRVIVVGRRPPPVTGENLLTTKLGEILRELGFATEVRRRFDLRNMSIARTTVWLVPGAKPFSFIRDLLFLTLWLACGNRIFCYLHNASRERFLRCHRWLDFLKNDRVTFVVITPAHAADFTARGYACRVLRNTAADVTPMPPVPAAKRLLWCSVVSEEKGFCKAAEAFCLVQQRDPAWVFDVFGTGPLMDREAFPFVRFHGFASGDRKAGAFRAGGVLILPSTYVNETQPLAVIEALGFGMPVVISNSGELPEMIAGSCGTCGFTLSAAAPASEWAEKILAAHGEYERLSVAAAETFREKFSHASYRDTVAAIMERSA